MLIAAQKEPQRINELYDTPLNEIANILKAIILHR